ncbi:flagellar protein export ATPase FliI [Paludibacterium yongneupense]|uniref:flagellar protein export ATPase FliI n=1 Tax=Paludibacterium yongneupense TaxID=400061 RepID=UPI0004027D32|nr:flagellar protein export ATPase FliI [Paludibacterium yongneupense]
MPNSDWLARQSRYLGACAERVKCLPLSQPCGRLTRVTGMVMEAVGLKLPVGSACQVDLPGQGVVEAEVVGFAGDKVFLMPLSNVQGLLPGTTVRPYDNSHPPRFGHSSTQMEPLQSGGRQVPVGFGLLGRVLDSLGRPLDDLGPIHPDAYFPLHSQPLNPLGRSPVRDVLDVGVRAINGLMTVGRGQRLGLFAGSGVGKSVLLGMMARFTRADVVVVGLIGERGREVKDFIEQILGEEGRRRSVVVAAPADMPPLMRLHGAAYATALAEYFRAEGKDVLLLMDSVTRYAMAQREIALAIGEPPVTKGYPPSVFARLPQLIERAGNGPEGGGSITAFYTVLSEGDDQQDPIADSARAILDGHFVLSRELAESGHYPAIDIEQSISRVMVDVVPPAHTDLARRFKQLYSRYQRNRDLISVGAYVAGSDPQLDEAIRRQLQMIGFLTQPMHESHDYPSSLAQLGGVLM